MWDEVPVELEGRIVEPMFVHLPPAGRLAAGVWAEVAVDGIILFERGMELSTRLVAIRHDIVSGRLVRKVARGQAHWTSNEAA